MKREKVELLAPAGNRESFEAACQNGADAVYMGVGKFNARVMAKNFEESEYSECIAYAHIRDVRVYLTLNTILYDHEMKEALELVATLYRAGLDAVIVQDIGLAMLIHQLYPDLALHASTQMGVYSLEQVLFLEKQGFKRVVLARELTMEEIAYICKNTSVEIEVFVHGALCVSYSGQCLLSSTIGERSANRGRCAQPCRMKYHIMNTLNKEILAKTYVMSKKDIFGLTHLDKLIETGVHSLKIEGRNKIPAYVACVTHIYRKYINQYQREGILAITQEDTNTLEQMFNRNGTSAGYLTGIPYQESITLLSPKNTGRYLGKVIAKNGVYVKIQLEEVLEMHDGFEIYSGEQVVSSIVTCIKDEHFVTKNQKALKGEYIWMGDVSKSVEIGSLIYKTSSESLNKRYTLTYANGYQNKKQEVTLEITLSKDKKMCVVSEFKNHKITTVLDEMPQIANNKATDTEKVEQVFAKTVDTPFVFNIKSLILEEGLFIPVSTLNELRRAVIKAVEESMHHVSERDLPDISEGLTSFLTTDTSIDNEITQPVKSLFIYQYQPEKDYLNALEIKRLYIVISDYMKYEEEIQKKYANKIEIYLVLPNVVGKTVDLYIKKNIEKMLQKQIKGFLIGSFVYLDLLKSYQEKYSFSMVADYSFNIANCYSAVWMKKLGFDTITPAYDMAIADIQEMSNKVPIELVEDYTTVMTSRYCILGSLLANKQEKQKCSMPCRKDTYYVKDTYGYQYHIICDATDCIMRLVKKTRNIDTKADTMKQIAGIRKAIVR